MLTEGMKQKTSVVELKMEGKRPRGRPKLRWKDTAEGTRKPGTSGRNGPLTGTDGSVSARPATPHKETAAKGEKRGDHIMYVASIWCFDLTHRLSYIITLSTQCIVAVLWYVVQLQRRWLRMVVYVVDNCN